MRAICITPPGLLLRSSALWERAWLYVSLCGKSFYKMTCVKVKRIQMESNRAIYSTVPTTSELLFVVSDRDNGYDTIGCRTEGAFPIPQFEGDCHFQ